MGQITRANIHIDIAEKAGDVESVSDWKKFRRGAEKRIENLKKELA